MAYITKDGKWLAYRDAAEEHASPALHRPHPGRHRIVPGRWL